MAVSFIDGGNQSTWRKPPTCYKSMKNFMVIGTDCTGSYKSNYHMITTPTPPIIFEILITRSLSVKLFLFKESISWIVLSKKSLKTPKK